MNRPGPAYLGTGDPVISVDTKKKELVGEYANKGRGWQPKGQPVHVNGHDFPTGAPKAIPYGRHADQTMWMLTLASQVDEFASVRTCSGCSRIERR